MKFSNYIKLAILVICLTVFLGCANNKFSQLGNVGSSILSSTGLVSSSQADALFKAGEKFSKGVKGMTEEEEYYLGRGVSATILAKYKLSPNSSLNKYVNKIGRSLALSSDKPFMFNGYHFAVLDSDEINAVSAPGGFVFVSKGFIKELKNEDELAAVIAHEIGHLVHSHASSSISQSNISEAILIGAREAAASETGFIGSQITEAFGDSITDVTKTLLTDGFSRSQEYEADEYAAALLEKSGYDATALKSVLLTLKNLSEKDNESGWFSTHPTPEKRLREVSDSVNTSEISKNGKTLRDKRFISSTKG